MILDTANVKSNDIIILSQKT